MSWLLPQSEQANRAGQNVGQREPGLFVRDAPADRVRTQFYVQVGRNTGLGLVIRISLGICLEFRVEWEVIIVEPAVGSVWVKTPAAIISTPLSGFPV